MQLSQTQLKIVRNSLHGAIDKNFSLSSEAIDRGDWEELDYRRRQRLELRELLDAIQSEIKK